MADLVYDTKKHTEGRWLPIYGEMTKAIAAQVEATKREHPNCPWLIHRDGQKVVEMRPAGPAACKTTGLKGLMFHDLRRSAIRNMVRAGIPEATAMKISGHKNRNVFDRYNIIDGKDIKDAGKKLTAYLEAQKKALKKKGEK